MKTKITVFILMASIFIGYSQETVGGKVAKNAKNRTYDRAEKKGDQSVDKALDKVEEGINSIFKKKDKKKDKKKKSGSNDDSSNNDTKRSSGNSSSKAVKKNSKFDFEPGQKQIGFDDFSTTKVGDFPLGWNTNSSAEIVTLDNSDQKWLSITKDGYFQPEFIKDMPNNFTLEFEMFTRYRSNNILEYQLYLMPSKNAKKDLASQYPENYIRFKWLGCNQEASFSIVEKGETTNSNNGLNIPELSCGVTKDSGKISKFSIWRQDGRLRIYIDENKVLDIPQAFDMKQNYNVFKIGAKYMNYSNGRKNDDEFMISNVRYAVAGEDTRSKLITEGRLVTNGILFDTNSDVIKSQSASVISEIAATLKENGTVRVKIIGHTDSDGDATSNLNLSKKRALAVKNALVNDYGIDSSRIDTDGKGESQPTNKNANATEKAQNRRVEFIKL